MPDDFCTPIRYVDHREAFPDLNGLSEGQALEAVNRLLFTKFADWRYEDEIRVTIKLDQDSKTNGMFFKEFDNDLKVAEVLVGIRSDTCRREIEAGFGSGLDDIAIIRAQPAADRFAIVASNDAIRNHDDLTYYLRRENVLHPVSFYRDVEPA